LAQHFDPEQKKSRNIFEIGLFKVIVID